MTEANVKGKETASARDGNARDGSKNKIVKNNLEDNPCVFGAEKPPSTAILDTASAVRTSPRYLPPHRNHSLRVVSAASDDRQSLCCPVKNT